MTNFAFFGMYCLPLNKQTNERKFVEMNISLTEKQNQTINTDKIGIFNQYFAELKIGNKFHFAGFLKGDDVVRMFSMSDVYVMPSVSEPFGISPLEAMRSNVPVIISNQSGVAEILKHAVKVDFWDVDAIANAIYGLVNYTGLSKMFRRYGRSEVENLKWENAAFKVKNVYESAINNTILE